MAGGRSVRVFRFVVFFSWMTIFQRFCWTDFVLLCISYTSFFMTLCGQCSLHSLSLITRAWQTPRISCIAQPGLVFDSFALSSNHYEYHESRVQEYLYGFKNKL
jgi:hypothetical protein